MGEGEEGGVGGKGEGGEGEGGEGKEGGEGRVGREGKEGEEGEGKGAMLKNSNISKKEHPSSKKSFLCVFGCGREKRDSKIVVNTESVPPRMRTIRTSIRLLSLMLPGLIHV